VHLPAGTTEHVACMVKVLPFTLHIQLFLQINVRQFSNVYAICHVPFYKINAHTAANFRRTMDGTAPGLRRCCVAHPKELATTSCYHYLTEAFLGWKHTKTLFQLGLCPMPCWGTLLHFPDTLDRYEGPPLQSTGAWKRKGKEQRQGSKRYLHPEIKT